MYQSSSYPGGLFNIAAQFSYLRLEKVNSLELLKQQCFLCSQYSNRQALSANGNHCSVIKKFTCKKEMIKSSYSAYNKQSLAILCM